MSTLQHKSIDLVVDIHSTVAFNALVQGGYGFPQMQGKNLIWIWYNNWGGYYK